jgi:hypothetical protein
MFNSGKFKFLQLTAGRGKRRGNRTVTTIDSWLLTKNFQEPGLWNEKIAAKLGSSCVSSHKCLIAMRGDFTETLRVELQKNGRPFSDRVVRVAIVYCFFHFVICCFVFETICDGKSKLCPRFDETFEVLVSVGITRKGSYFYPRSMQASGWSLLVLCTSSFVCNCVIHLR